MEEQQEETEYVEHQYMCSECHELFNTLEDVLIHQRSTRAKKVMEKEREGRSCTSRASQSWGRPSSNQCLECGALLVNPEELLQHQEMHMREAGMEVEHQELCEVFGGQRKGPRVRCRDPFSTSVLDCLALFDSPDTWLEHRRTHSRSSTHSNAQSNTEIMEYVLQEDGTITPLNNVQNYVLSEQQAGEILAQVLAQQQLQQQTRQSVFKPAAPLPLHPVAPAPLQAAPPAACAGPGSSGVLENGVQRLELRLAPSVREEQQATEVLVIHPYECSECSLLFQTPEDFLQHQGEHFLCQDKESGEPGDQSAEKKAAVWAKPQQCELCSRTFTSVNRLAAHRRVHEQGTHECPECGKVFKKATSMQTHMRTHSGVASPHIADPLHKCQFCNKTFTNMTKYLYHRRTHLNRDSALTPAPIHRNSADTPAPTSTVLAPRRVSLSTLAILQRAREKNSHTTELKINILTSHKQEEMGTTWTRSRNDRRGRGAAGEDIEMEVSAPPEGTTIEPQQEKSVTNSAPLGDTGGGVKAIVAPPASSDKTSFSCRTCSKTFPSQLQLVHHRRKTHVTERSFMCGICGKTFKKQIHVRNHIRTHTGERPFQCSECGKTFSFLANLTRHTLIHSGVRPYRCDVCHLSFSQSSNLRHHSLLHSSAATLCCPDCPATFRWPTKLAAHRYTQHQGSPAPFPCPHCEAGFLTRRQREGHFLELHPTLVQPGTGTGEDKEAVAGKDLSSKPSTSAETESGDSSGLSRGGLDCNICGKKLNSPANLRLHRLSHFSLGPGRTRCATGKRTKTHQCPICGKLFVSSSGVALHQRVHTGERPFPCQECGKRFRQNTHLREHLRTHSGERPFRCELCGKGFIQSMHLVEHRRTHTGERPHVCPLCGKAFKTFST
ncbi:hypothetical protein KUCAC02_014045 [Chaenocephalus aceratus]|uniref:Uncharacterized protein n=1 Tax=Chaenocephalus aceratus TaxID=36190 RepID=A0ACB9WDJ0_CHAAC|nr:hypothetical protein KUCAC02_014045 [Chaenocephalus aceratus]